MTNEEKKKQVQDVVNNIVQNNPYKNGVGAQSFNYIMQSVQSQVPTYTLPKSSVSSSPLPLKPTLTSTQRYHAAKSSRPQLDTEAQNQRSAADVAKKIYEEQNSRNQPQKATPYVQQQNQQGFSQQDSSRTIPYLERQELGTLTEADKQQVRYGIQAQKAQEDAIAAENRAAENEKYISDLEELDRIPEEDLEAIREYNKIVDAGRGENFIRDLVNSHRVDKIVAPVREKYGVEKFDSLAETLRRDSHTKQKAEIQKSAQEFATESPIASSALTVAEKPIGALGALNGRINEAFYRTGNYSGLEEFVPGGELQLQANTVRNTVSQNIKGDGTNPLRNVASFLYNGGMGAADMVTNAIVLGPALGRVVSATNQFTQTISDATARGATPEQAYLLASANAAIDYLTEKIPMENLAALAINGDTNAIAAALKQFGIESTQSGAAFIGSMISDMYIMQGNSEYQQAVLSYMEQEGISREEAAKRASMDLLMQGLSEVGTEAIAGGISAGVSAAIGNAKNKNQLNTAPTVENQQKPADTAPQSPAASESAKNPSIQPNNVTDLTNSVNTQGDLTENSTNFMENARNPANNENPQMAPAQSVQKTVSDAVTRAQKTAQANQQIVQETARNWAELRDGEDPNDILDIMGEPSPDRSGVQDPMGERTWSGVGKRGVKAYMYDNPEVKPFFQEQAAWLLNELQDTTKGERFYNDKVYYDTNGAAGFSGTKRHTSESIAQLLDQDGMTYDQIERGLYAIMHDEGAENNAVSKRIEFVINDRLMNGYTDFYTGKRVEGNTEYLNLLRRQQTGADENSVGAANANFTGRAAYEQNLTDNNVKPARPTDARNVEVPEYNVNGRRVSDVAANLVNSKNTTDAAAAQIDRLIQDGVFDYDPKTNRESLLKAYQELESLGQNAVLKQIGNNLGSRKIQEGDIERAIALYQKYMADGNEADATELYADLSQMATMSGRNLQLFRLIRSMSPEGQLAALQKTGTRFLNSVNKPKGKNKGKTVEAVIPDNLKTQYLDAVRSGDENAISDVTDAISLAIGSQAKSTVWDKWDAWRHMCMLGNIKTNVRNIAGNALMEPYAIAKDKLAASFEAAFVKQEDRTKSFFTDKKLLEWARQDAKSRQAQDALQYSAKIGDDTTMSKMQEGRRIFKNGALESARKLSEVLPKKGDTIFENGYYARYLANFLTARGYKAEDITSGKIDQNILAQARQYAVDNAMRNTLNDSNAFSDFVSSVNGLKKSDNWVARVFARAVDGVLPYRRTPANILVRFKEYSLLEILTAAVKMAGKKTGKFSQSYTAAQFCNDLASGLTGTAAMALGGCLVNGLFTENGDGVRLVAKASEEEKLQGSQDWSIEVTKDGETTSYSIEWAAPANLPLFVGANLYNAFQGQEEGESIWSLDGFLRFCDGSKDALEPMLSLSCLSPLNDLVESGRYAEEGEVLYSIASQAAVSYLSQGVPALLRQLNTALQKNQQATFANDEREQVRGIQRTISNIPFLGNSLKTDKIDVWGQKIEKGSEDQRFFDAFVNPFKVQKVKKDAVTQEISRLTHSEFSAGVMPSAAPKTITYMDSQGQKHENVRLTASQWETYATDRGQLSKSILDKAVTSQAYKNLTEAGKQAFFQEVYAYADKSAAVKAIKDHDGLPESWMEEARDSGDPASYIVARVTNSELNRTIKNLQNAWRHGSDRPASRTQLEESYQSYTSQPEAIQKAIQKSVEGATKKYLEGRDAGLSQNTTLSAIQSVSKIPEANRESRSYQMRAISSTSGISEKDMDTAMKLWLPDYDPNAKDKDYAEVKYEYIRQELGYTPQQYSDILMAYATADDRFGDGNTYVKKSEFQQAAAAIGIDSAEFAKLWSILYGSGSKDKKLREDYAKTLYGAASQ